MTLGNGLQISENVHRLVASVHDDLRYSNHLNVRIRRILGIILCIFECQKPPGLRFH